MIELIILGIVFYVGYQVGMSVLAYRFRDILYKEAKAQGIDIDAKSLGLAEPKPTVFKLIIERANNILYLYDYEANTFVCQGSTIHELAELAQKYKNIKYAVVAHGDDMLMFVDGAVKEKNES